MAEADRPSYPTTGCGKCSAACPVVGAMDRPPHVVVALAALGDRSAAMAARGIWACMDCRSCTAACPQGIDVAGLFDELRAEAVALGAAPSADDEPALAFHKAFLGSVRRNGRAHAPGYMAAFRRSTGRTFRDLGFVVSMLFKGKLRLRPRRSSARGEIREMVDSSAPHLFEPGGRT